MVVLSQVGLGWVGFDSVGLCSVELGWSWLGLIGLGCVRLCWVGMYWFEVDCIRLNCTELINQICLHFFNLSFSSF